MFRRQTGQAHKGEKPPVAFPAGLEYLWRWFQEVEAGRSYADGVPLPIPSSEYLAWARLGGVHLRPWEVQTLRALDATALKVALEKAPPA